VLLIAVRLDYTWVDNRRIVRNASPPSVMMTAAVVIAVKQMAKAGQSLTCRLAGGGAPACQGETTEHRSFARQA
jgi:hypothetical protein